MELIPGVCGLPAAGTAEAAAIAAEIDRARDGLDAVSDLLLAESVHQATQGNLDRTQSALQALTAPGTPPEPEIFRTPRSGRVLTFRALLALDVNATDGWSRRFHPARVQTRSSTTGSPALAGAGCRAMDGAERHAAPASSFAGLGLEPIDVVLMSGETLGDQSSELERT